MTKFSLIIFLSVVFTSCVVSKKKYLALEQELTKIKADLKDDDNDGIPNYIDLEPKTEALAEVDKQGRTIIIEKIVDMDHDGVLDVNDFCPTIKGIATANGCPDRDGDGVYDFEDKCPSAAGLKKDGGCPIEKIIDKVVERPIGNILLFQRQSANFTPETKLFLNKEIDSIAKVIIGNQNLTLVIRAFTDNLGDSIKNIKLSEKRAEKVKELLLKKGVTINQLKTVGMGSVYPLESNETKKGRNANNRVEFLVTIEEK